MTTYTGPAPSTPSTTPGGSWAWLLATASVLVALVSAGVLSTVQLDSGETAIVDALGAGSALPMLTLVGGLGLQAVIILGMIVVAVQSRRADARTGAGRLHGPRAITPRNLTIMGVGLAIALIGFFVVSTVIALAVL